VQGCGDAHLSNFGVFASPERQLVFDLNNFDETHLGPWEWDVKRLAASMLIAARSNNFSANDETRIVLAPAFAYRNAIRRFAQPGNLAVWYAQLETESVLAQYEAQFKPRAVRRTRTGERDFYCRQLKDWKGSAEIDQMLPPGMEACGRLCGWTLARAHARTGDRVAIAAYLGTGDRFDRAILEFARAYAAQNERDDDALVAAVASGRVTGRDRRLVPASGNGPNFWTGY
jgi:hypothetical protein